MSRLTATDPPRPMPWLCRLGFHAMPYSDTLGKEMPDGSWLLRTVPRCNRCHHEVGEVHYTLERHS